MTPESDLTAFCLSCSFSLCVTVILTSYSLELYLRGLSEARVFASARYLWALPVWAPLNENIPCGLSRVLGEA